MKKASLIKKLTTGQSAKNKSMSAELQMGHLYHHHHCQGSGTTVEDRAEDGNIIVSSGCKSTALMDSQQPWLTAYARSNQWTLLHGEERNLWVLPPAKELLAVNGKPRKDGQVFFFYCVAPDRHPILHRWPHTHDPPASVFPVLRLLWA